MNKTDKPITNSYPQVGRQCVICSTRSNLHFQFLHYHLLISFTLMMCALIYVCVPHFTTKTKGRYSLEVSHKLPKEESRGWKWPFGKDELILLKEQVSETSEWIVSPCPQGLRGSSEEESLLRTNDYGLWQRKRVSTLSIHHKAQSHHLWFHSPSPHSFSPRDVEEPSVGWAGEITVLHGGEWGRTPRPPFLTANDELSESLNVESMHLR